VLLHPALYLALLAAYLLMASSPLRPPRSGAADADDIAAFRALDTLDEMLRHPRDVPFANAAAVMVPLFIGSALLLGYVFLRAHGVVVFPRRHLAPAPWPTWHLLRVLVVLLVVLRAVGLGAAWLMYACHTGVVAVSLPRGLTLVLGSNVTMLVVCAFIVGLVGWGQGSPFARLGLSSRRPLRHLATGVAAYLMVFPVMFAAGILMFILGPRMGLPPKPQEVLAHIAGLSPLAFLFVVFSVAVVTPLTEEVFFRGFLHATLRRHMGPLGGIVLSAAAFAAMHGYAFGFLPLFVLGFLLAYLYERTGSLTPSIAAHAANNCYALLVTYCTFHQAPF